MLTFSSHLEEAMFENGKNIFLTPGRSHVLNWQKHFPQTWKKPCLKLAKACLQSKNNSVSEKIQLIYKVAMFLRLYCVWQIVSQLSLHVAIDIWQMLVPRWQME